MPSESPPNGYHSASPISLVCPLLLNKLQVHSEECVSISEAGKSLEGPLLAPGAVATELTIRRQKAHPVLGSPYSLSRVGWRSGYFVGLAKGLAVTKCGCRSYKIWGGRDPRHRNFWHPPSLRFAETSEWCIMLPGSLVAAGTWANRQALSLLPLPHPPRAWKTVLRGTHFAFLTIYLN